MLPRGISMKGMLVKNDHYAIVLSPEIVHVTLRCMKITKLYYILF